MYAAQNFNNLIKSRKDSVWSGWIRLLFFKRFSEDLCITSQKEEKKKSYGAQYSKHWIGWHSVLEVLKHILPVLEQFNPYVLLANFMLPSA